MDRAREPSSGAAGSSGLLFAGLVGMVVLWAALAGDASAFGAVLPVGGAAVVLLLGAVVAMALGRLSSPRVGRSGAVLVAVTVALVAWTGVTVAWSIVPDRSWDVFNKGLAYAAFLGLGIVLAGLAGRSAARCGASLLALVTAVVLVWALLAKAVPSLDPEGDRVARLREPVGYWNALALLADLAIVLGLWLGAPPERRAPVRIAGALLAYAATLALLLTLSRAGMVAGAAVVALWLVLSRERVAGGLLLAASAGPALLVGAWAFTRPALVEDVALRADREADGAVFGVLALAGAALAVLLVGLVVPRLGESARRRSTRALVTIAVLCVVGAVVALGVGVADAVSSGRSCSEVVNDPGRLGSLDPNNRWCWWNEAWDVYAGNAPEGAGAGSFEVARKRYRVDARNVLQPHSVPLQQLADGGLVALGLFVLLVASGAWVCACAVRRLEGDERAAAIALVAAPAAYLLHAVVDYSWDFLAVTAPTLLALGVLAAAGRVPPRGRTGALARRRCRCRRPRRARVLLDAAARRPCGARVDTRARRRRLRPRSRPGAVGAVPQPALGGAAVGARPAGGAPRDPAQGRGPLRAGDRAAAGQPGDVVRARPLRVRGAAADVRRVHVPQRVLDARPVREPVDPRRPAGRRPRRGERGRLRALLGARPDVPERERPVARGPEGVGSPPRRS
ncbi:MAG TPA: O-antigen ligase family protein [Gaiellaceae bacterium]|nr:O-antigen ligase family protein [Gaiellaceae bacterium]